MRLEDTPEAGRGWCADRPLPAGYTVLRCWPLASVLDAEADAAAPEDERAATALLVIRLAEAIGGAGGAAVAAAASQLHPREPPKEGEEPWRCDDRRLQRRMETALSELAGFSRGERRRLVQAVKLNNLGMYTNSEQLSYDAGPYAALAGVALYKEASFFNHSCTPNLARYNIGELAVFRTNQPVSAGQPLCISYIEHDLLSEPPALRNQLLGQRDFQISHPAGPEPEWPVISPEVQSGIAGLAASERLETIRVMRESAGAQLHQIDSKELDLLAAGALAELGEHEAERRHWRRCIRFARAHCPPNDESLACYHVQASLAALADGDDFAGWKQARRAVRAHQIAFGGGLRLFKARYKHEVSASTFRRGHERLAAMFWRLVSVEKIADS